jgi:hypothetical protein
MTEHLMLRVNRPEAPKAATACQWVGRHGMRGDAGHCARSHRWREAQRPRTRTSAVPPTEATVYGMVDAAAPKGPGKQLVDDRISAPVGTAACRVRPGTRGEPLTVYSAQPKQRRGLLVPPASAPASPPMRSRGASETLPCMHPNLHMQLARAIIAERLADAKAHQAKPRRSRRGGRSLPRPTPIIPTRTRSSNARTS